VQTLAQQYQISAMPTLILIKNKVQVDQIVGANLNLLKSKIAQHTGAPALAAA
jgi:thioredoxin-like negative regulator of GroEL